jgi:sarcosine oxidase subunit gamma
MILKRRRCMSDVAIEAAPLRSVAGIGAFGDPSGLLAALQGEFGVAVPAAIGFAEAGAIRLSRLGPSRFLVSGDGAADLPGRLARLLEGVGAVTDQSDLWICFVVSGGLVREVLSRVVPVDIRAAQFPVGGLALTRAGHLDVRLFRTGELQFEIAVGRSYAADLRHLLEVSARS